VRQKEREFAVELLKKHDPVKDAATKHSWLMFTVPERPVAGAHLGVFFWGGGVVLAACHRWHSSSSSSRQYRNGNYGVYWALARLMAPSYQPLLAVSVCHVSVC
jgi:hypothetical protein